MSGIGSSELIILLLIGLIILGPKRLPQIANQLGSWIGQARRMTRAMKRQLEDELDLDENFRPRSRSIAPPVASRAPDPADPAYDYDPEIEAEADAVADAEAYVPNDDDTYSPAHDDAGNDEAGDAKPQDKGA
jgi:sec-independent protein translocase protein TatB